jgi:hypothetical protein
MYKVERNVIKNKNVPMRSTLRRLQTCSEINTYFKAGFEI